MPIVKTQVSSALRVPDPASAEGRELLARFDEPRFLHQVRERVNSHVEGTDDLPEALDGGAAGASASGACTSTCRSTAAEHTTQDELSATLAALAGGAAPLTRHFEVETYTWSVMRDAPQDDEGLVAGLAGELEWTRDRLVALGAEVRGMTLVVIDAVGLTPRALKHMPRVSKLGADGFQARLDTIVPAVTCSVQATLLTGLTPDRPRHRRQRLVLPRPRRGLPLAPAQQARAGREGVGDRAPRQARLPRREPLLVVRDGRLDRPDRHAAPDLPRRRPQVAGLLHVSRRSCTTT